MKRLTSTILTLLVAVVLASCGGGGGTGTQNDTGTDNNPGSGDVSQFDTDGDGIAEQSSGPAGVDEGDNLNSDPDRRAASIPNQTPDQPENTVKIPVISPMPADGVTGPNGESDWNGVEIIEKEAPSALEDEGPVGRFGGSGSRSASQTGGGGGGFVIDRRVIKSTIYENQTFYMFRGYDNAPYAGDNAAKTLRTFDFNWGDYDGEGTAGSPPSYKGWTWQSPANGTSNAYTNTLAPTLRGFTWAAHLRPGADNRWIAEGNEHFARPGSAPDKGFYIRRAEELNSLTDAPSPNGDTGADRPHCPDLILLGEMANLYQRQDFYLTAKRNWDLYYGEFLEANSGDSSDAAEDFVDLMTTGTQDVGGTEYDASNRGGIAGWDLGFCIDGARLAGDAEAAKDIADETLRAWDEIQSASQFDELDEISQAGLISALARLDVNAYEDDIEALLTGGTLATGGDTVDQGLLDAQHSQYGYFTYTDDGVDDTQLTAYSLSALADYKDALEANGGSFGIARETAIDKAQDWLMLFAQVQDQNTDILEDTDLDGYSDRGAFLTSVLGFDYGDKLNFEIQGEVVRALVAASEGKQPFPLSAGQVAP